MKRIISIIAATLLMTGCVTLPPTHTPTKTSLELQIMQSRDFDNPKRVVFASTIGAVIKDVKKAFIADGNGVKEPVPSELPDRLWRADPSDGLRPLNELRAQWK